MARNPALISAHRITWVPSAGLWKVRKTCKFPIKNFRVVVGWGYTQEEACNNWYQAYGEMMAKFCEAHYKVKESKVKESEKKESERLAKPERSKKLRPRQTQKSRQTQKPKATKAKSPKATKTTKPISPTPIQLPLEI